MSLPNDPYTGFQLDPRISASNNWGMGDDPTLSGAIGNYLIRNVPNWARGAAHFFNPSQQSSLTSAQPNPLGNVFSGLRPQPLPATPAEPPPLVGASAPLAGPLATSAAPTPQPQPQPQPPGTTLTSLPARPYTPTPGAVQGQPSPGYGSSAPTPPARPYTPTPGAVQGQPSPGYGQTSQSAPPTDPNSPRGTNQQPGYYTPTTGIARGPGTWHPGSIADAIHNAGVGLGQHLDQTFGVTRPAGYYDYRGQGQPTYNGPLSKPVVNNMGGGQGVINLPTSYPLPSGMRMTPQGDVIGQPKQGWQGWQ